MWLRWICILSFFFFSTFLLILLFCSSTINPLTFMLYSSIDSICQRNSMRSCRYIIFILFEIYFNGAATPMKSPSVIIFICVLIVPRIGVCIHEYSTANENKDSCYMRTSSLERNWPTKASPVWFAWFYMDWRCCCGGDGKMATMPNSSMTILWKRSGEDENEKKRCNETSKKKKKIELIIEKMKTGSHIGSVMAGVLRVFILATQSPI